MIDLEENLFRDACAAYEAGSDPGQVIDDGLVNAPKEFTDEALFKIRRRVFDRVVSWLKDWPSRLFKKKADQ